MTVRFREPLDHALAERVIALRDKDGRSVEGSVQVQAKELEWVFRPAKAWRPGDYRLVVSPELEDLAGNSVGRPFEEDPKAATSVVRQVEIPFRLK